MKLAVPAVIKKVPPMGWLAIGGVLLAVLYLRSSKGTGASSGAGVGGGGGGGQPQLSPDLASLMQQQADANAAWQKVLLDLLKRQGTTPTPADGTPGAGGGTHTPNRGLPGSYKLTDPGQQSVVDAAMATLSSADQSYWSTKLAAGPGSPYTYDAATNLAQWLDIAKNNSFLPNASGPGLSILPGAPRNAITPVDLRIGLASAWARFNQSGSTQAQLAAAQSLLGQKLAGGNYGIGGQAYNDPTTAAYAAADLRLSGGGAYTIDQINYINKTGGSTVENLTRLLTDPVWKTLGKVPGSNASVSPSIATGGTTDPGGTTAARIAALQSAIAWDSQRLTVQQGMGNGITAAKLQASLAAQKAQLAKLL